MTGVRRGPTPKDEEARVRAESATNMPQTKLKPGEFPAYVDINPTPPDAREDWHAVAQNLYNSLKSDPARMNMTTGDWQLAWLMCENISRDMKPQVVATIPATVDSETGTVVPAEVVRDVVAMNGARMAAVLKWAAMIGLTDGARRSIGLHLQLGIDAGDLNGDQPDTVKKRGDLFLVPTEDDE